MSFDWQQESKEKYFRKAEERIEAAGFSDLLHIDRTMFCVSMGKIARVHVKIVRREGNQKRWRQARKKIEGFQESPAQKNEYGKKEKTLYMRGYFEIEMEEQDK